MRIPKGNPQMTGGRIRAIRDALRLDPHAFAGVLGVAVSTIYRWEAAIGAIRVDPMQAELLAKLEQRLKVERNHQASEEAGRKIVAGLVAGGMLLGLAALISFLVEDAPSPPQTRRHGPSKRRS